MSQTLREKITLREQRVQREKTRDAMRDSIQWWLAATVLAGLFLSVLVWSAEHDAAVAERERVEREARLKRSPCTLKEVERHPYPYAHCIATVYKF